MFHNCGSVKSVYMRVYTFACPQTLLIGFNSQWNFGRNVASRFSPWRKNVFSVWKSYSHVFSFYVCCVNSSLICFGIPFESTIFWTLPAHIVSGCAPPGQTFITRALRALSLKQLLWSKINISVCFSLQYLYLAILAASFTFTFCLCNSLCTWLHIPVGLMPNSGS